MKVLMVMTSHDKLGNTGRKTGFWLEEFAAPYFRFIDAGVTVTVVSPKGGRISVPQGSGLGIDPDPDVIRIYRWN